MNLFRPSELHLFLEELGIKAKKSLSQNFLIDGNILRKIVETAAIQPGDAVIEIGPGPGALTEALLKAGAHVTAIEKDTTFASALSRLQTEDQRLSVIEGDCLEIDFSSCFGKDRKVKVVANLPYHIATAVIIRLVPLHEQIATLTLMVQKEVAQRLTAKKGSADYSSLTVYLQYFCQAQYAFTVGPNCFFPRPKVDSAVVHFTPVKPQPISSVSDFFQMTRTAFQQRRKMLRSSLSKLYPREKIEAALQEVGLNAQARPEELSLADFIAVFERL